MKCKRCQAEVVPASEPSVPGFARLVIEAPHWCEECERGYDTWSRQHASDIIWPAVVGMFVVATIAVGIPLLGVPWVFATTGIVAGAASIIGVHRWNRRRRRMQFLSGAAVPRAYLPDKTT